jgi:hypothetical protein
MLVTMEEVLLNIRDITQVKTIVKNLKATINSQFSPLVVR